MAAVKAITRIGAGITAIVISTLPASAMPETAKQETIRLIDSIGTSGCEFERNGEWFKAPDAVSHLKRKLNATESRLATAEQFIAHVASVSSVSGKPYHLRCAGATEEAKPWLEKRLATLRGN